MNTLLPVVAKLPVLIVLPDTSGNTIPNVVVSPFVKVKVFPLNDAVTNELAVTDELTNPNAVICALPEIVPVGNAPPNDDVATKLDTPLALPTHAYPSCNDAVKVPVIFVVLSVF